MHEAVVQPVLPPTHRAALRGQPAASAGDGAAVRRASRASVSRWGVCVAEVRGRRGAARRLMRKQWAPYARRARPTDQGGERRRCRPLQTRWRAWCTAGWAARPPALGAELQAALAQPLRGSAPAAQSSQLPGTVARLPAPLARTARPRVARPTRRGGPRLRCGPAASRGLLQKSVAGWGGPAAASFQPV